MNGKLNSPSMRGIVRSVGPLAFAILAVGLAGCDTDDQCPIGTEYNKAHGACLPVTPDGGGTFVDATPVVPDAAAPVDSTAPAPDSGADALSGPPDATGPADALAADAGGEDAAASNFGTVCGANTECTGAANYCNKTPGAPTGYCSATGCDMTPSLCPATWTCFNLGMFSPGLPFVCRRP